MLDFRARLTLTLFDFSVLVAGAGAALDLGSIANVGGDLIVTTDGGGDVKAEASSWLTGLFCD